MAADRPLLAAVPVCSVAAAEATERTATAANQYGEGAGVRLEPGSRVLVPLLVRAAQRRLQEPPRLAAVEGMPQAVAANVE